MTARACIVISLGCLMVPLPAGLLLALTHRPDIPKLTRSEPNYNTIDWDRDITTFNCAGLALRQYRHIEQDELEPVLARLRPLSSDKDRCPVGQVKLWVWTYDCRYEMPGVDHPPPAPPATPAFHIVGGLVEAADAGSPPLVFSKCGDGPIIGPATPESFRPAERQRLGQNRHGQEIWIVRENIRERCYAARPSELQTRSADGG